MGNTCDGFHYDCDLQSYVPDDDIWHPILFKGRLVRGIIAEEKTETRRVMRAQPVMVKPGKRICAVESLGHGAYFNDINDKIFKSPYGSAGHKLWVRETWAAHWALNDLSPSECMGEMGGDKYWYEADLYYKEDFDGANVRRIGRWRPSIHMPRGVSRLSLLVRSVGCERLQDMTEQDAIAEGVDAGIYGSTALAHFKVLWDSINKDRVVDGQKMNWDSNPYVWVIKFRLLK